MLLNVKFVDSAIKMHEIQHILNSFVRDRSGIYPKIRITNRKISRKKQDFIHKSGMIKFILILLFKIKSVRKWINQ